MDILSRRRERLRSIYSGLPLQPPEPQAQPPSLTWQTVPAIVVALSALFSVITQSKDHPVFAWTLVGIAVVALTVVTYRPVLSSMRERAAQRRRNLVAERLWPELLLIEKRFRPFLNPDDSGNLRSIVFRLCGSMETEHAKICPPDYLREMFALFSMRHEDETNRDESAFCAALDEFHLVIGSYNRDYVLTPLKRLREGQSLAKLPENYRQSDERTIEDFRERWVRFLDDFKQFLERVNNEMSYSPFEGFSGYFERPTKL